MITRHRYKHCCYNFEPKINDFSVERCLEGMQSYIEVIKFEVKHQGNR